MDSQRVASPLILSGREGDDTLRRMSRFAAISTPAATRKAADTAPRRPLRRNPPGGAMWTLRPRLAVRSQPAMRSPGRPGIALVVLAAGACLGALGFGCPPPGREPGPAALLCTLDTFRADHLGCAGHPTVRTPHLDRFARGGLQWPDAVTGIPLTTPSHATLLTGRSPRSHGVLKNRMRLRGGVPTIAEGLAEAGVRTGAVVSSALVLGPEMGLDRGFGSYDVVIPDQLPATGEGAETTRRAIAWLEASGGPGSFLWVHYFDAHLPYLPPEPLDRLYDPDYAGPWHRTTEPVQITFREEPGAEYDEGDVRHLAALYAAEITFLDICFGKLVRAADEAAGPAGRAAILVTADHGEGLWEHERYFGHDILLYETSMRVPMLMSGAGAGERAGGFEGGMSGADQPAGRLVLEPARTRDAGPTILGWFGLDPDADVEGRDLLREPPPAGDDLQFIAESHPAREKSPTVYAVRTGNHKVVWIPRNRRHEAYDLAADPAERHDLWGTEKIWEVLAEDLVLDLRNRPVGRPRTIDEEAGGLEGETREALRSLGYVD